MATVHAVKSITEPTWTHLQAGESIPVQKWNSLQGGQIHDTDAAAGASNDLCGLRLSSFIPPHFSLTLIQSLNGFLWQLCC